ncbi:riboflavin biosynthesis protein RibF [Synergistaceae bacterium OttesenSCG-928-I11]|nr:riboflavin biosynthesis protein RibF [Synergistaceae bacterium OttesenSCG-928-I11]
MIAAFGAFDGFHKGHQTLLAAAARHAEKLGCEWGVVTFSREKGSVLGRKGVRSLFTNREQAILERYFRIPTVRQIDFTEEIAAMTPDAFLDYAADVLEVDGIVVGCDFRFGKDRQGTTDFLMRAGAERGWVVDIVPIRTTEAGVPICSTTVRNALSVGDMRYARELLGYPYFCASRVIHGNERGRKLGFPTANIEIPPEKVDLLQGVYATIVRANGAWHIGAANVGDNPTFDDVRTTRFEVNLVNYRGDLYGSEIVVFLVERIRDEIRFETPEALTRQVKADTEAIVEVCGEDLRDNDAFWRNFADALTP